VSQRQDSRVFGKRPKQHTIIIASGDRIRHVTVRPWLFGLGASFLGMIAIGYLAATSYLVLRDDLIGAAMARQARMQHAYEDRIASLRSQVDRVTSRQLLDQQLMEDKVAELMARQQALTSRHGRLGPLLERVMKEGVGGDGGAKAAPGRQARADTGIDTRESRLARLASAANPFLDPASARLDPTAFAGGESVGERADRIFSSVTLSLKSIERDQVEKIQDLAADAYEIASQINEVVASVGLPTPEVAESGIGGPFIRPNDPRAFEASLDDLDAALGQLETVRRNARALPVSVPAAHAEITSTFGTRDDPFLRRPAFHSGIDFRAATGTPVHATGGGTVVSADRNGGYGNMVEIDHGNGITTRYAHLSRILVDEGERVEAGAVIGKAGSTGRSTGPHIHYEIRRNGNAVNPIRFIKAAQKLKPLMQ